MQERCDASSQPFVENTDRVLAAGNDRELDRNARAREARGEPLRLPERHDLGLGMSDENGRVARVGMGRGRGIGRLRAVLVASARFAAQVVADDAAKPEGCLVGGQLGAAATRDPSSTGPSPRVPRSAARLPPADPPKAPMRVGSRLKASTCSGARSHSTARATSSIADGKSAFGTSR